MVNLASFDRLSELSFRPLSFEIRNESADVLVHAGVLDFTAEEGDVAYLPAWMMEVLKASDGLALR